MKGIQPSIVVLLGIAGKTYILYFCGRILWKDFNCLYPLYPVALANPERCCQRKTVGDKSYTLVESGGEVQPGCKSSCVYTEDDDPSKVFCFGPGDMSVTCHAMPPSTGRCHSLS